MASEVKSVPPVGFRRHFHNLPKRERQKREREEEEQGGQEKSKDEEQRERPGDPDGESTIDVTA